MWYGVIKMDKGKLLAKLASRKFWSMLLGLLSMVLVAYGMPQNQVAQILSIAGGFGGIIVYILAEAYVDANSTPVETPSPVIPQDPTK